MSRAGLPALLLGRTDNRAMHFIDLLGMLAAVLTTASFVPQTIHTFRTRDVSGISLVMYSAFTAGVAHEQRLFGLFTPIPNCCKQTT